MDVDGIIPEKTGTEVAGTCAAELVVAPVAGRGLVTDEPAELADAFPGEAAELAAPAPDVDDAS